MLSAIREVDERVSAGSLPVRDASLLKEYLLTLQAERGLSDRGLLTEFRMIVVWCRYLTLTTMTTGDIMDAKMQMDARGLNRHTMRGYLYKFLRFARWCAQEKGMTGIDVVRLDLLWESNGDSHSATFCHHWQTFCYYTIINILCPTMHHNKPK